MTDKDRPASRPPGALARIQEEAGDRIWMDVIRKMDEVYQELLGHETELEQKNAALEESQQFIVSVLASISDVLIVCDRAGSIEDVNASLVALTGREERALKGSSVFDLFADDASRRRAQQHFTGEAAEPLHDCEMNLRGADGTAIPVSLNCTPRYNAAGRLLGSVITGRPVGELRRAYTSLREAHDDLKRTQQQLLHSEKIASLGRLVAGVAHELNNPISFVLGNVVALKRYTERLQRYCAAVHGEVDPAERERLRTELRIDRILEDLPNLIEGTVEGAERTRDIVDALKRFSSVDPDERSPCNLVPVIERAVHWVSKSAPESFRVTIDLPEELITLGSAGQMQQVFMNLVQNAVDAMTTIPREDAVLEIVGWSSVDAITIEFRDHGPGIVAADLHRIFDPFFTTKPVGKGTGLGLAISYGIVERHGGRLSAANRPDGGAVFTVCMPRPAGTGVVQGAVQSTVTADDGKR